jgi:hypothetical protein
MERNHIENKAKLFDSNLKKHPSSSEELQKLLADFAEQLINESKETFEYRVIDHDMFDEHEIGLMNSMGLKGWEIFRILEPINWKESEGKFTRTYYKRKSNGN